LNRERGGAVVGGNRSLLKTSGKIPSMEGCEAHAKTGVGQKQE